MKDFTEVNKYRVRQGPTGSSDEIGKYGMFEIPMKGRSKAVVMAADGDETEWEHVSVHIRYANKKGKWILRTPTWEEMCLIKEMFWDDDETVMQLHPPKSQYVNNHNHCLHLWRPQTQEIPLPPKILVGV